MRTRHGVGQQLTADTFETHFPIGGELKFFLRTRRDVATDVSFLSLVNLQAVLVYQHVF